jgi:hypothetical protein
MVSATQYLRGTATQFLPLSAVRAAKLKVSSNVMTASLTYCVVRAVWSRNTEIYLCIELKYAVSTFNRRFLTYSLARRGTAVSLTGCHSRSLDYDINLATVVPNVRCLRLGHPTSWSFTLAGSIMSLLTFATVARADTFFTGVPNSFAHGGFQRHSIGQRQSLPSTVWPPFTSSPSKERQRLLIFIT